MSALDEADFGSDTDDDDYVPEGAGEGHEASEEEHSGEEENNEDAVAKIVKGKRKKKAKKVVNGRKNMFSDDSEKVDWVKELEDERKELNEEKKKQKAEDLFAAFKKDTSSVKNTSSSKTTTISSLFDSSSKEQTEEHPKKESMNTTSRLASLFDDPPNKYPDSREKSTIAQSSVSKPKSLLSGLFDEEPESVSTTATSEEKSENSINSEDEKKSDKIEIKKVFDFAGEMVTVSKEVAADSSEAKKYLKSQEESNKSAPAPSAGAKRPGGLAGIVGSIGKKQKMGVLDKSKLDWNSFVSREGISEELKTHNKGKDGYVEKQMFLERADLRQFEIEKSIRDKNRKSLMK